MEIHKEIWRAVSPVLSVFRQDMLGASLAICYNFTATNSVHCEQDSPIHENELVLTSVHTDQDMESRTVSKTTEYLDYLEKASSVIEDTMMLVGAGIQDYYAVCACIGLLKKSIVDPTGKVELEAADKLVNMVQRMVSLESNLSAAATLASLPNMVRESMKSSMKASQIHQPTAMATNSHMNNGIESASSAQIDSAGMLGVWK